MTAARPHDHVPVLLQDDVGTVVEVQDGDGVQLGGGAARLGNVVREHQMNLRQEGTQHVIPEWKWNRESLLR